VTRSVWIVLQKELEARGIIASHPVRVFELKSENAAWSKEEKALIVGIG
jgi:hypothetical protein